MSRVFCSYPRRWSPTGDCVLYPPCCYTHSIPKEVRFLIGLDETERQRLERFVERRARYASHEDMQAAEDLAQEARLALLLYQRRVPEASPSHLVMCAKGAISDHLRRGSSVDTPYYAPHRDHHYELTSLDAPQRNSERDSHELLSVSHCPTEMLALARVLLQELLRILTGEEAQALQLRLSGFDWSEIGELLYREKRHHINEKGETMTEALERSLQEKAGLIWEAPAARKEPSASRKRKGPSPRHKLDAIPERLLPHLTAQEIQALELYGAGQTQVEAAQATGMSQSTFCRLLAFVRRSKELPDAALRRWRNPHNPHRRKAFFALFEHRPPGALVSHAEMLAFFADTKHPADALAVTIERYNRQLTNARIAKERDGYRLV